MEISLKTDHRLPIPREREAARFWDGEVAKVTPCLPLSVLSFFLSNSILNYSHVHPAARCETKVPDTIEGHIRPEVREE